MFLPQFCNSVSTSESVILLSLNSFNYAAICQLLQSTAPAKHRLLFPVCIPNPPQRRIFWPLPDLLFPLLPNVWMILGCRTALKHTQNTPCLQQARSLNMVHLHTVRNAESATQLPIVYRLHRSNFPELVMHSHPVPSSRSRGAVPNCIYCGIYIKLYTDMVRVPLFGWCWLTVVLCECWLTHWGRVFFSSIFIIDH
jgi:hypothetical protein